jgi:hypothetical protein
MSISRAARFVVIGAAVAMSTSLGLWMSGCKKQAADAGGGAVAPGAAPGAAPPAAVAQHVDGTPHTDAAVKAWQGAGLTPEGFAPLTPAPFGAAYCEQGRVQAIDTVVCEYRDQEALTRGKAELLEQWGREGANTAVAFQTKLTLLGAMDRARRDPNGKVISQLVDAFRKL